VSAPSGEDWAITHHANKWIPFHESTQRGHFLLQVVCPHLADAQLLMLELLLPAHGHVVLQTKSPVGKAHLSGGRSGRYARSTISVGSLRAEDAVPRGRRGRVGAAVLLERVEGIVGEGVCGVLVMRGLLLGLLLLREMGEGIGEVGLGGRVSGYWAHCIDG
jgi:hypothetical protein